MRILFAAAECAPMVRVGGLAEAASGLVAELRTQHDVTVVLPDYGFIDFVEESSVELDVPDWAAPARARFGTAPDFGSVVLVDRVGMARPHPYVDPATGNAWPDNDHRFIGFSAALADLIRREQPDVVHLNDWHTAATLGFLAERPPTVLTIHTLGYQGVTDGSWLARIPVEPWRFAWYDVANMLVGAVRTADRIIAVSPNYAREIVQPEHGMAFDHELAERGSDLVGILNGIDDAQWSPKSDSLIPTTFGAAKVAGGKADAKAELVARFGWDDNDAPLIGVVSRLVDQKGIDLLAAAAPFLDGIGANLVVLGAGTPELNDAVRWMATEFPGRVQAVVGTYDVELAHLIFAGADLMAIPSRFEPCGLAQMQAMNYGTIPVASAVGGLVDTISDIDADPDGGTGVLLSEVSVAGLVDGFHRGVRAWSQKSTRRAMQRRGMKADWSWTGPAKRHVALYQDLLASKR